MVTIKRWPLRTQKTSPGIMTGRHLALLLTAALWLSDCGFCASVNRRSPRRVVRSANAPAAVDCEYTGWGVWSDCDPCTGQRYRSRSIVKFGQYGGRPCLLSLGDFQRCKADKPCLEPPIDCGNDYECESGRCIKQRLLCNGDNDCGDNSDELCDDGNDPRLVCRTDIELSEIGHTAGQGFNFLGMEIKTNPFDNEFFNGVCDRVRDGNRKTFFRKPWNVAALVYQTRADKSFTSETYKDAVELLTKIVQERTQDFEVSLSVKWTSTEHNDTSVSANLGINTSRKRSLEKIKEYSNKRDKTYLRVSGSVQLGTFQMRTRSTMLSSTFIEDVNSLPSSYQKAEYFAFMEMYGTHYAVSGVVGGKYELVYVLDSRAMKSKEVTTENITKCLGYNAGISLQSTGIEASAGLNNSNCKKFISNFEGNDASSPVIEKIISFVEGGTVEFSTALEEKLSQRSTVVDVDVFTKWASSLVDAPVVTKRKLEPIYTLIPVDLRDAYPKKKNLEKAIVEYLEEYNVCKCQPCQNGGTVVLLDGECVCKCPLGFTGIACETLTYRHFPEPYIPAQGTWSCWTPSSSCVNEVMTRTRKCSYPAQLSGARPCSGESRSQVPC